MYAVTISEPGGPEVLRWVAVPDPVPAEGEVIVDVVASAVNRADLLQRRVSTTRRRARRRTREWSARAGSAHSARAVTGWRVGDEVCALLAGGGYAERVAVPVGQLLPVPAGVDLVDAAALPEVACTVWSNLVPVARLRAGQTLLVHGGGSGIGTFAIQFAPRSAHGADHRPAGQARSAAAARCRPAIDYTAEDFVAQSERLPAGVVSI